MPCRHALGSLSPWLLFPNHAEQWVNARTIVDLGVGAMAQEERLEEAMVEALGQIDRFRAAYAARPLPTGGAEEAASLLHDLARGA